MSAFVYVNSYNPCPLCGRKADCRQNRNGLYFCHTFLRDDQPGAPLTGWDYHGQTRDGGTWGMWTQEGEEKSWREDNGHRGNSSTAKAAEAVKAPRPGYRPGPSFREWVERESIPAPGGGRLAELLGLQHHRHVFDLLPVRHLDNDRNNRDCWLWPEVDGDGHQVAWGCRYDTPGDNKRTRASGFDGAAGRGLIVPAGWRERAIATGAVLCVEGMSDTATGTAIGLGVVGRPNNTGGADQLARLIANAGLPPSVKIVVIGENDRKEDGTWPGREGAQHVARHLVGVFGERRVKIVLPPAEAKDLRGWFLAQDDRNCRVDAGLAERFAAEVVVVTQAPHAEAPQVISPLVAIVAGSAGTNGASTSDGVPSFYEQMVAHREQEAAAKELIEAHVAAARAEEEETRCLFPRWEWQCRKDLTASRTCEYRCKGCIGCIFFKKRRHKRNIENRIKVAAIESPEVTFVAFFIRRWKYDLHGRVFAHRFVRLLADSATGEQLVIGQALAEDLSYEVRRDCGEDGIQTLTPDQAIRLAHSTIDQANASAANGRRGTIAVYGHEWKLSEPKSPETGAWMKGKALGSDVNAETILEVAEAADVVVKGQRVPAGLKHRFSRMFYFRHKPGWKMKEAEHFYRQLAAADPDYPRLDENEDGYLLRVETGKQTGRHRCAVFDLADV